MLKSGTFKAEKVFESSGTTKEKTSKHYIKSLELYHNSFNRAFDLFYGKAEEYCILALLPSYLERENSSLVYMAEHLIDRSNHPFSGFFLNNYSELSSKLNQLAASKQKTLLIGVSFGLLDFIENNHVGYNPNLIVMETGGMKGKRKELVREELHALLRKGFKLEHIHSEYGMTELLSQAYSKENGLFRTPPWMKVLIRKQDDPFVFANTYETGAINLIDLANIYSCAFIQTDDLGRIHADCSFEVLGRFDRSDVRGCNLMTATN